MEVIVSSIWLYTMSGGQKKTKKYLSDALICFQMQKNVIVRILKF